MLRAKLDAISLLNLGWWPIAKLIIYVQTSFDRGSFMVSLLSFWFFFHMIIDEREITRNTATID